MLQQQRRVFRLLHVHFEETLRAEGGIGGYGDALALGVFHQAFLREVRVVFDLQRGRADLGVPQEIHEEDAAEIAHADAAAEAILDKAFHGRPRFLDACVARGDFIVLVGETGWVFDGRVDVFEADGEVHDVEVEVVDAPVLELFLANGLHAGPVVEGVPKLGDEEEVGALAEVVFEGAGDALAGFDFIAVVWWWIG